MNRPPPRPTRHRRGASHRVSASALPSDRQRQALDRLTGELLGICTRAARRFGAHTHARAAFASARYARQLLEDAGAVAMLHTRWQRERRYVDEDGNPKPIAARGGAPSFEALCRDNGLAADTNRLLEMACRFGLCSRAGRGRLVYGSDVLLFTGHPTLMLARAVVTVERFLATCLHNAEPGRRKIDSLGDRTTEVNLSPQEYTRLAKDIRRSLSSFIESTDRRLLAAATRSTGRKTQGRRMCGVTAFAFRD